MLTNFTLKFDDKSSVVVRINDKLASGLLFLGDPA